MPQFKKSSTTPAPSTSCAPSSSTTSSPRTSSSSLSSIIAATLRVLHVPSRPSSSSKSFKRSTTLPAPTTRRTKSEEDARGRGTEPEWLVDEDGNVSGFGTALAKFPTRESVASVGTGEGESVKASMGKSRAGRDDEKLSKKKSLDWAKRGRKGT